MSPAWIKQRPLLATSKPSLRKPWDLDAAVLPGTVASIGSRRPGPSGDVDLRDEHGRATRERIGGDGRRNCARATRERISREDERFSDKNSWVHYFRKCQVKKCQTLRDELIFPLTKRLGTWQTSTNGKFQLHNC